MALTVILLCGPRKAGKSLVARIVAATAAPASCWHLRVLPAGPTQRLYIDDGELGLFAGATCLNYDHDRVFELLPDALRHVSRHPACKTVLIEADANPALRHAYPYDYRLFVLPAPRDLSEVFRTPAQAAAAMKQVMQDTASFAAEIFGLFDGESLADDPHLQQLRCPAWQPEPSVELDQQQLQSFLASPLGAEVASRIQLQPAYHGLIESDIVILNHTSQPLTPAAELCRLRLQTLLARLPSFGQRQTQLYCCSLIDQADPSRRQLLRHLSTLPWEADY